MFVKITGLLGGKRAIKSLGAFCLALFGTCGLILSFGVDVLQPAWVIWIFWGGSILGFLLLIGGIFASDI